jgi:hypothetical protein
MCRSGTPDIAGRRGTRTGAGAAHMGGSLTPRTAVSHEERPSYGRVDSEILNCSSSCPSDWGSPNGQPRGSWPRARLSVIMRSAEPIWTYRTAPEAQPSGRVPGRDYWSALATVRELALPAQDVTLSRRQPTRSEASASAPDGQFCAQTVTSRTLPRGPARQSCPPRES